ncbi:MAG: Dihydroneopterin aldolase, partial [uncultured Arthrobacter sp.]
DGAPAARRSLADGHQRHRPPRRLRLRAAGRPALPRRCGPPPRPAPRRNQRRPHPDGPLRRGRRAGQFHHRREAVPADRGAGRNDRSRDPRPLPRRGGRRHRAQTEGPHPRALRRRRRHDPQEQAV